MYLAGQVGVSPELRGDVVGRGGVEVGPRVQAHVALGEPRPGARLATRQHCNRAHHVIHHIIFKLATWPLHASTDSVGIFDGGGSTSLQKVSLAKRTFCVTSKPSRGGTATVRCCGALLCMYGNEESK